MNKIIRYISFIISLSVMIGIGACVKDRNDLGTDFSNLQPIIEIRDNNPGNDAGLANFARATLLFSSQDPDSAGFYLNIASVNVLSQDITVTVDIDDAAIAAYNASSAVQYAKLPDDSYSFTQTQFTIKAGERVAFVPIIFFPDKIDPTKDFMLPISIKDAQGQTISGNFGTIYYHTIGNLYAGNYSVVGYRRNFAGTGGGTFSDIDLSVYSPKLASPETKATIAVNYANFGDGANYHITFDLATETITDVTVDESFTSTVANFGIDVFDYNKVTKVIHIKSHYTNGTPSDRVIEEWLTKE